MISENLLLLIVEPNIDKHPKYELVNYKYAVNKADIVVFLVAHKEFGEMELSDNKNFMDFCGINQQLKSS